MPLSQFAFSSKVTNPSDPTDPVNIAVDALSQMGAISLYSNPVPANEHRVSPPRLGLMVHLMKTKAAR